MYWYPWPSKVLSLVWYYPISCGWTSIFCCIFFVGLIWHVWCDKFDFFLLNDVRDQWRPAFLVWGCIELVRDAVCLHKKSKMGFFSGKCGKCVERRPLCTRQWRFEESAKSRLVGFSGWQWHHSNNFKTFHQGPRVVYKLLEFSILSQHFITLNHLEFC